MSSNPPKISESIVESAALDWLRELGYDVLSGLVIAPGEPTAERTVYKQVFLLYGLQTKLRNATPSRLLSEESRVPAAT